MALPARVIASSWSPCDSRVSLPSGANISVGMPWTPSNRPWTAQTRAHWSCSTQASYRVSSWHKPNITLCPKGATDRGDLVVSGPNTRDQDVSPSRLAVSTSRFAPPCTIGNCKFHRGMTAISSNGAAMPAYKQRFQAVNGGAVDGLGESIARPSPGITFTLPASASHWTSPTSGRADGTSSADGTRAGTARNPIEVGPLECLHDNISFATIGPRTSRTGTGSAKHVDLCRYSRRRDRGVNS